MGIIFALLFASALIISESMMAVWAGWNAAGRRRYHPHPPPPQSQDEKYVFGNCFESCNALHDQNKYSQIFVFHIIGNFFWSKLVL